AIVQRDKDDALANEGLAPVSRLRAGAGLKAAAMNPHHDRQPLGCAGRCPDVHRQAVLARRLREGDVAEDRSLHALTAELGGVADALPRGRRLWLLPPEVADRRRCVRNALEYTGTAIGAGSTL